MAVHEHDHPGRSRNRKRLAWTLALVLLYMLAELVGAWLTGSLALLADAGHMLSDAASLGLALFALWLAARPSASSHTWGYYRTEILAALLNGATLVAISLFVFYEAEEIHDLHVWTITSGLNALSAHVVCCQGCDRDTLLSRLREKLRDRFKISHVTIQVESPGSEECRPNP